MPNMFSLCLTAQNKKNHEQSLLFRLADKVGNELVEQYNHIDKDFLEEDYYNRNFHPKTHYKNHRINELKIWEWDTESNDFAERTHISFFELVSIPGIESLSEDRILNILKEGFNVPIYCSPKFLLLIEENDDTYKVLEMEPSNVKSNETSIKLIKGVSKIKGYSLLKKDFITTERVDVFLENGELEEPRKIYKFTEIDSPSFIFETFSYEEKLMLFFNERMKRSDFSNEKRKTAKNMFNELLENEVTILNFFKANNFSTVELGKKLYESRENINNILGENSLFDKFCETAIENLPILTDKFEKMVRDKFDSENQEKLAAVESKILEKEDYYNNLMNTCEKRRKEIDILTMKKRDLEIRNIESEKLYDSISDMIGNKSTEIKRDMTGFLIEMSNYGLLNENKTVEQKSSFNFKPCFVNNQEIDNIDNLNEFVSVLISNLRISGVDKSLSEFVAAYITVSIEQKINLLLTGRYALSVANAISATYCGKNADIISICSPEINVNEIFEQINLCKSEVIVIENLIAQNDNVALQIIKANSTKLIIFTNDFSEIISFIPNSFWDRFNLLCLDNLCERQNISEFDLTVVQNVIFETDFNKQKYLQIKKFLKKDLKECVFNLSHRATKAELITRIDNLNENSGLFTWLLCETLPKHLHFNENENFMEIINTCKFSEPQRIILENIFWC